MLRKCCIADFFMPKLKPSFYYIMSSLSFLIENKISTFF